MSAARSAAPFAVVVACVALLVPLQNWFDARADEASGDYDEVYLTDGSRARMLALGYDSLLSDVYWVRAIQFFGRKILNDRAVLNDPRHRLDELYPLLDVATTLDPRNVPPYRFGGFFVYDYVDKKLGRELLEKGVNNNPEQFRLYQDLAFLTLNDGDCAHAADLYARGGEQPGAPGFMRDLAVIVNAKCGRVDLAYEMLQRQYDATDDPRVKQELGDRIQGYVALGEANYLRALAESYRQRAGQPPPSLAALVATAPPLPNAPELRLGRDGAPVDPKGVPYVYDRATGAVAPGAGGVALPTGELGRPGQAP